jgi:hypothetical protein
MVDTQRLRGLILSAVELRKLTDWDEAVIEDYLNIIDNLLTLSEEVTTESDKKLEEIPTDLESGLVTFSKDGFLSGEANLFWNFISKLLQIKGDVEIKGKLDVTSNGNDVVVATVKGAADQTADILNLNNSSDVNKFRVRAGGNMVNIDGHITTSAQYGSAFWSWNCGEDTPEHTNQTGSYDHTGGAQDKLFTKTAGDDFTSDDATNGNWILLTGVNLGAVAEIKEFIDADNVTVDGMNWDTDLASQTFQIFKHPAFVTGDGNKHEFSVGSNGEFEIFSYGFVGGKVGELELDAAADNIDGFQIKANANGNNIITGMNISYVSGALGAGEVGGGLFITLDESGAVASDSTTVIACLACGTTTDHSNTRRAVVVLPGFTEALKVIGAEAEDPDYGYENTLTVSTDRVTGGAGDGQAFLESSASDLEIFENEGDYVLIGSDSTFEIIEAILTVGSSKDIEADYFYSKAGGDWTILPIQGDSTNGAQNSGSIIFTAPGDWTKDDEDIDGNAITDAYYIAIQRTRVAVIVTLPTEDFFKTFDSIDTGMTIDGGGFINPRSSVDGNAPNNSVYYSETQSKLVYKDPGGSVNDLY